MNIPVERLSKRIKLSELSVQPRFGSADRPTCRLVVTPRYDNPLIKPTVIIDLLQN